MGERIEIAGVEVGGSVLGNSILSLEEESRERKLDEEMQSKFGGLCVDRSRWRDKWMEDTVEDERGR